MSEENNNFVSITQKAEELKITARWLRKLTKQGRIPGAIKIGKTWAVPANTKLPNYTRNRPTQKTVPKQKKQSAPLQFSKITTPKFAESKDQNYQSPDYDEDN